MSLLPKKNKPDQPANIRDAIIVACEDLKATLLEKNESYGNSVGDPLMVFSRSEAMSRINVRLDDKLSRIARGHEYQGDDTELDIAGYLILKRALRMVKGDNNN